MAIFKIFKKKEISKNQIQFKKGKPTKDDIAVWLFIISCVVGCLALCMPNHNLEMICTGISVVAAIGFVIMLFICGSGKTGGSFNPEFENEIEEARREEGYFGKEK